jgi:hypothetical protein
MRHPSTVTNVPWIYARSRTTQFADRSKIGKWVIFVSVQDVDKTWAVIEHATTTDRLGPASKVATNYRRTPSKVICAYTNDYSDLSDVRRVLAWLRELGFNGNLSYKEDNATRARLYGRGSTLYTSYSGADIRMNRDPMAALPKPYPPADPIPPARTIRPRPHHTPATRQPAPTPTGAGTRTLGGSGSRSGSDNSGSGPRSDIWPFPTARVARPDPDPGQRWTSEPVAEESALLPTNPDPDATTPATPTGAGTRRGSGSRSGSDTRTRTPKRQPTP